MLTHVASNLKRRHRKSKLALAHIEIAVPCGLKVSIIEADMVRVTACGRLAYAQPLFNPH